MNEEIWSSSAMILTWENPEVFVDKSVVILIYPPQISHTLAWDRTRPSGYRGRALTT